MNYNIIVASTPSLGIGKVGTMAWKCIEELRLFRNLTMNNVLIVGRTTYQSLPLLKDRTLFCVSRTYNTKHNNECVFVKSVEEAIRLANEQYPNKEIFVAGGGHIYNYCFANLLSSLKKLYISRMDTEHSCDVFIKFNIDDFVIEKEQKYTEFTHEVLRYEPKNEKGYLDLMKETKNAKLRATRNGNVYSLFGRTLEFNLLNGFPLLTTKKMFTKGIIEELLFFVRGHTNTKFLEEQGINIWKGNTSRTFLDNLGFKDRKEGEMGPMYGYQWRNFNSANHDQLKEVVKSIRTDPNSRRHLLTDFNPLQAHLGVLYPCHSIIIQFYVEDEFLDMSVYNRSQDLFLGTPFNIASSALFMELIARITCLKARKLVMNLGDVHIYENHLEAVETQIKRRRYAFPQLVIKKEIQEIEDIETMSHVDFVFENYNFHPVIKAEMIA